MDSLLFPPMHELHKGLVTCEEHMLRRENADAEIRHRLAWREEKKF